MEKTFIVKEISQFAKTIGDVNPLHHDNARAREMGFEGIVAPGVMVMGFVSATIAEMIPMAIVRHLKVKFLNPLYENSVVRVICVLLKRKESFATVEVKIYSTEVVAKGSCLLLIPQIR